MTTHQARAALVAEARTFANTLQLALHSAVGSRATIHPARAERAANAFDRLATALEESARDIERLETVIDEALSATREPLTVDSAREGRMVLVRFWNERKKAAVRAARASAAVPGEAAEEAR